ncbi:hypothetical protein HGRIS_008435 [Hohenbuehelia grisea]|uniref:Uncharacterized protein n=1 Tax=Hohenbuehelia grisea TaxID=104357 RepID=A0ABR3J8F5_9AGAR
MANLNVLSEYTRQAFTRDANSLGQEVFSKCKPPSSSSSSAPHQTSSDSGVTALAASSPAPPSPLTSGTSLSLSSETVTSPPGAVSSSSGAVPSSSTEPASSSTSGPSPSSSLITAPLSSPEIATSSSSHRTTGKIAGIVVGIVVASLSLVAIIVWLVHRQRQQTLKLHGKDMASISGLENIGTRSSDAVVPFAVGAPTEYTIASEYPSGTPDPSTYGSYEPLRAQSQQRKHVVNPTPITRDETLDELLDTPPAYS